MDKPKHKRHTRTGHKPFMLWMPEEMRDAIIKVAAQRRQSQTVVVQLAIERFLASEGIVCPITPPESPR